MSFDVCLYRETFWIEGQVACHFKLVTDTTQGGFEEFVFDTDVPAFLERKLVGFDVGKYW